MRVSDLWPLSGASSVMSNTSTLIIELTNNRPSAPVYLEPEYELSLFVELGWADIHAAVCLQSAFVWNFPRAVLIRDRL